MSRIEVVAPAVADLVAAACATHRVCVVASAMAGITNLLLHGGRVPNRDEADRLLEAFRDRHARVVADLAQDLGAEAGPVRGELEDLEAVGRRLLHGMALLEEGPPSVLAQVSSLGERASSLILTALLKARGLAPRYLDPTEHIKVEGDPLQARPRMADIETAFLAVVAAAGGLWVLPGFFGGDAQGRILSLGRGGSDHSAALAAAALKADLLEIWTDVAGLYSADPSLVPEAFPLPEHQRRRSELAQELGVQLAGGEEVAAVAMTPGHAGLQGAVAWAGGVFLPQIARISIDYCAPCGAGFATDCAMTKSSFVAAMVEGCSAF